MISVSEMRKKIPEHVVRTAEDIHGHMSPGLAAGFKMILFGLDQISISPQDKIVIVSESVRCLQDASFSVCSYLIQENNWRIYPKTYDVGKVSIQILKNYNKHSNSGELYRVVISPEKVRPYPLFYNWLYQLEREKAPIDKLLEDIYRAPDEEIFKIRPFSGKMTDLCHMTNKNLVQCPQCGEFTEKATFIGDICRICAYFEE
jgi:formylmethanofuran dehydrogenase subunit E